MLMDTGLSRRAFTGLLGVAALGGCVTVPRAPVAGPWEPRRIPGQVSEDLIDRVTVGLRPGRRGGFRLEAQGLGDKWLIHNYGHYGFGISLSWGSSELAVDLAPIVPGRQAAVLGCGIMGLATARIAQERGAKVTVYARDLPPRTTSNVSGGQWWPGAPAGSDPAYHALFRQAAQRAFARFRRMEPHARYGVWWQDNWQFSPGPAPGPPDPSIQWLRDTVSDFRSTLNPGEHPFGDRYMTYYRTLMVEPGRHLETLMHEVRQAGGVIVQRGFSGVEEIAALPQDVVFNCTGLGAGALFGDPAVLPVRGQLVVLRPQPQVRYNLQGMGGYQFARPDGLVLGGTETPDDWRLEPDPADTARILAAAQRAFGAVVG